MARSLRVALICGNRIVDDRVFAPGTRVTVGQSASDTFIVPREAAARSRTVFQGSKRGWQLNVTPDSDGQISTEHGSTPLTTGATTLDERSRGRVRLGEIALLFQFVDPPPRAPVAELPKALRGSFLAQVDRAFLAVLAISLGAHFAGAGWLVLQPTPPEPEFSMEELPVDRFARQVMPVARPTPTEAPKVAAAPAAEPQVAAAPKPSAPQHRSAADLNAQLKKAGLLAVIGAQGPGGAIADVLGERSALGDVASALSDASAVKLAAVGEVAGRKGSDTGQTTTIGALQTGPSHEVNLGEVGAVQVAGRVNVEPIRVDTHEFSRDDLAKWVHSRTQAIQGCYERELKRNQTLRGRVVLHFAINHRGRVQDVSFDEDTLASRGVTDCIAALVSHWVLPFTPEDEVPVAFPWVFTPTS